MSAAPFRPDLERTDSAGRGGEEAPRPEAPLEWTVNPWRRDRGRALAGVLLLAGASAATWSAAGTPLLASALSAALAVTLGPAFVPARIRVDAEGVGRRLGPWWERRAWSAIRRARLAADGLFVSPLAVPSFRDRFRGLLLPVPADLEGHDALLAELRRRLARHGL